MNALVSTVDGTFAIDLETEEVLGLEAESAFPAAEPVELGLPRVVASASSGSTVVAVVDRRPPLVVSY